MNEKLNDYFKTCFLKDLLFKENITDISFNGHDIYYQDNLNGRKKFECEIDNKKAYEFIRQIANLSDSQFSFSSPILDISIDRYRINAIHSAVARKNREPAINFSIRIGFSSLRIKEDNSFIKDKCITLIDLFIKNKQSIIIGGQTSSGKTELQKFILSRLKENSRIIVLDNVEELETDDFLKNIDSQTWLLKSNNVDFDGLVKNALRNNPDWLIVSEARGEEMMSILNSAMTGHPTISTIHAKDCSYIYRRMGRMCLLKNENMKFNEVLEDIYDHFKLVIYVKKVMDKSGKIYRYIEKIASNYNNEYYDLFVYPDSYYPLKKDLKIELNLSEERFNKLNKWWANKEKEVKVNERKENKNEEETDLYERRFETNNVIYSS